MGEYDECEACSCLLSHSFGRPPFLIVIMKDVWRKSFTESFLCFTWGILFFPPFSAYSPFNCCWARCKGALTEGRLPFRFVFNSARPRSRQHRCCGICLFCLFFLRQSLWIIWQSERRARTGAGIEMKSHITTWHSHAFLLLWEVDTGKMAKWPNVKGKIESLSSK